MIISKSTWAFLIWFIALSRASISFGEASVKALLDNCSNSQRQEAQQILYRWLPLVDSLNNINQELAQATERSFEIQNEMKRLGISSKIRARSGIHTDEFRLPRDYPILLRDTLKRIDKLKHKKKEILEQKRAVELKLKDLFDQYKKQIDEKEKAAKLAIKQPNLP